ncbi:hypothetical protein M0R45_001479 [Rubus argutus]|uniref:Uncharacterized protein n=1 Tax=Rubus argutus TaxID=59490 RepID=A0AAW1VLB3_RUBAR
MVIEMPDLINKLWNPEPKMSFGDFIRTVEDKYIRTWDINWNGGSFIPLHANDMKIQEAVNLKHFKPHKCYIQRLQDCLRQSTTTFENKSDLTHDTDIQNRVTQEYEFETALADLIDNSLQAVWSNDRRHGKHIRVGVVDSMISIFDSVPRMAGSCEEQAIGGQPSNLKTGGSIRVPAEEEISRPSLGSFTQIV